MWQKLSNLIEIIEDFVSLLLLTIFILIFLTIVGKALNQWEENLTHYQD